MIVQLHRLINMRHYFTRLRSGCVSVGAEREEELPASEVSQLAPRPQRVPDHVHHDEDRQDGQVDSRHVCRQCLAMFVIWPLYSTTDNIILIR